MIVRKMAITLVVELMAVITAIAQNAAGADIVTHLNKQSNGKVTVVMSKQLEERLKPENGNPENGVPGKAVTSNVGYRIQVYSGSNAGSKREAESREASIMSRFPSMRTSIIYKAPSWRLRVGDFRTRDEAKMALEELRQAFPGYAKEFTVVVDRINL
ncbi:MAG: SPOR domain-containing protein [Muribaculaceae bacterium]|nr:SPOR domain-containing protein [Muribaculaceae bacterium]